MRKINIADDIIMYQLVDEATNWSVNITAVYDGDEFALIDTGYEVHMKELQEELDFTKCKYILFTHQHPDHTFGAKILEGIEIVGHKDYRSGFDEFVEWMNLKGWSIEGTIPSRFMNNNETLSFGKHTFTFIHNPIHTRSSMLIDLNSKYLFTGDEILTTVEGSDITSIYFSDECLIEDSYNTLLDSSKEKIVLPGHGKVFTNGIEVSIKKRVLYLSLLKEGITFEKLSENGFECEGFDYFHEYNLGKFYKG